MAKTKVYNAVMQAQMEKIKKKKRNSKAVFEPGSIRCVHIAEFKAEFKRINSKIIHRHFHNANQYPTHIKLMSFVFQ